MPDSVIFVVVRRYKTFRNDSTVNQTDYFVTENEETAYGRARWLRYRYPTDDIRICKEIAHVTG